ncbi:hypothetical protein K469DRAFT_532624, partial [Zopfia rhizophila CBS 207.26]
LSSGSGYTGTCTICNHLNNEHRYETCMAVGCRKKWKVCQAGGQWRLCKECNDHP